MYQIEVKINGVWTPMWAQHTYAERAMAARRLRELKRQNERCTVLYGAERNEYRIKPVFC